MFPLNEAELPPFLKRVRKSTDEYSVDSLEGYYEDYVKSKSDYENHGSAFGGPTYGAKFKQEDVLEFLKKFPGATAKEIQTAFGGDSNWKNLNDKLSRLKSKKLIVQTDQFATKGRTKFTWFAIEDFEELLKYQESNKIGKIKLTEEVDINIGADFLKVFKEKFPTLTFKADEANQTQEWIDNYGDSLDDGNLNQYKEFLIGNDFASLKIEESEEVNEEKKLLSSSYMKNIIKPIIKELEDLPGSDDPKESLTAIIEKLQKLKERV